MNFTPYLNLFSDTTTFRKAAALFPKEVKDDYNWPYFVMLPNSSDKVHPGFFKGI